MVKRAGRGGLVQAADDNAQRHIDAARRLADVGQHDFAAFHLVTALEEVTKARFEEAGLLDLFRGTPAEGQGIQQRLDKARHEHDPKIAVGLFLIFLNGSMIATLKEMEQEGTDTPPGAGPTARRLVGETVTWLIELLEKHPGLREEAIYSGPGPDGLMPEPVDWKELVDRVLPLLQGVVSYQKKVGIARVTEASAAAFRHQVAEFLKTVPDWNTSTPAGTESKS